MSIKRRIAQVAEQRAIVPPKTKEYSVGVCRKCGSEMPGSPHFDRDFGKLLCWACRVPGTADLP